MTVHKFDQNMAIVSDEFVFGDDFDAILDALEDDDAVQEEFNAAVEQVCIDAVCRCLITIIFLKTPVSIVVHKSFSQR